MCLFLKTIKNTLEVCLIFKASLPSIYSEIYNILRTPQKFVL